MASTYENDLRLEEMATGENSGSWGTKTNTNLELIADAFGYGTETITTNADTHTTTIADGASDAGRAIYLKYTGTLDSACTITIGPNTVSKMWFIENATSGSQNIIISQGSGANITIGAGKTKIVYSDGAGAGAAFVEATDGISINSLFATGGVDITGGFTATDGSSITTADNTVQLTLISTDADASVGPQLELYRNSGSPADSDTLGFVTFKGRNDNSQDVVYAGLQSYILDASDGTEDGYLVIDTMVAGTARERISIDSTTTTFNEEGEDIDFRVESDSSANALFVEGSSGRVGIGTSSMDAPLHVEGASGTQLVVEATSGDFAQMDFKIGGTQKGAIWTHEATDLMGFFAPSGWGQNFYTNGTETMRLTSSGNVGIGDTSPSRALSTKSASVTVGSFESTSASGGLISFVDPNTTNDVTVRVGSLGNNLVLQSGGSERMRIDSSGIVYTGKSSSNFNVAGIEASAANGLWVSRTNLPPTSLNRLSSDGQIATYYKDNTLIGNIANSGTNFIIQQSNSGGVIQLTNHDSTEDIEFGQDYFRIKQGGAQRMHMNSAGETTFTTKVSVTAADGVRDADYVASFHNQEATSGRNFGVSIAGGTSSADIALNVVNGAANTALLRVHGDGTTNIGTTLTFGGKVNVHEGGVGVGEASSAGSYRRMYWNASNNEMRFWNGNNEARITDAGAFTDASDVSLKKDIAEIEYGIDTVKALKPRRYKLKSSNLEQVGFVAQEMETQVPEVVSTGVTPDGDEQKGISYGQITAVLTKAIQEQQTVIEALTARITALEGA